MQSIFNLFKKEEVKKSYEGCVPMYLEINNCLRDHKTLKTEKILEKCEGGPGRDQDQLQRGYKDDQHAGNIQWAEGMVPARWDCLDA